jgi:hypothetical protein
MKCYCGMFQDQCPYEVAGVCHNEIDATECCNPSHCSRCHRSADVDADSGWCQDCLWLRADTEEPT